MQYAQLLATKQRVVDRPPRDVDQEVGRRLEGNTEKTESGS